LHVARQLAAPSPAGKLPFLRSLRARLPTPAQALRGAAAGARQVAH
jgi:hypothetical protein